MLRLLQKDSWQIFWLLFHVGLGFACVGTKWVLIGWFALLMIDLLITLFSKGNAQHAIIYFLGYSLAVEVLARGVNAAPFIPDQMGKYLAVVLFALGLAMGGPIKKISFFGAGMLLLSLPGLTIAPDYTRKQIVFNYFGPLALFLGTIFCSRQIMTFTDYKKLVRIILYSILALACFTIFRAAQFEKIEYSLSANYEAAGGSITNQVSTLFGTAICLMFLMYLTKQQLFRFKFIDVGLILLFTMRGLLTFSRGGMVSALIAILVVIIFPKAKAAWQDNEITLKRISAGPAFFGALILFASFFAINQYTNNYLLYRYQGKTERSLQTGFSTSVTLDQISSGRSEIFLSDIAIFVGNPALGVGVGQSTVVRPDYGGAPGQQPHLEISRLVAEHGLPGLVLVIMIYVYPFFRTWYEPNNYRRAIQLVFLIMALTATFHSAMRTMITPLFFAFAFINFVPTNYDWKSQLNAKKVGDALGQRARNRSRQSSAAISS